MNVAKKKKIEDGWYLYRKIHIRRFKSLSPSRNYWAICLAVPSIRHLDEMFYETIYIDESLKQCVWEIDREFEADPSLSRFKGVFDVV